MSRGLKWPANAGYARHRKLIENYRAERERTKAATGVEPLKGVRRPRAANTGASGPATKTGVSNGGGTRPPSRSVSGPFDDGDDLARMLDRDFAAANRAMTEAERRAIREWQASGRSYEAIQHALRSLGRDREADRLAKALTFAIRRGSLAADAVMWRGVRSSTRTFGVPSGELGRLVGEQRRMSGFLSVTLSRQVAELEFTRPALEGGALLLRVSVRKGTHAAWVAGVGSPRLRRQLELLLKTDRLVRIRAVSYAGTIPVVDVEVMR
ncbi:MAG: ADP-ribosyltransferase [Candidatus Nanopelagicales bacterium]|nr:ADP-ribosyltransferase [Candidatus Nanopelagicales bacterium]